MAVQPEDIEQAEFELQIDQQNLDELRAERATLTDPADIELLDNAIADAESGVEFRQRRLDNLKNTRGNEQSSLGQTAEQITDNENVGTDKQDLTENERQTLESQDRDQTESDNETFQDSELDDTERAPVGNLISIGDNNINAGEEQKRLSSEPATTPQNKLHQFESYTYRLTLYALTRDELARLNNNPGTFSPRHVLVSSGGSYALGNNESGRQRHKDFEEDFYFEDFDFTTVVGMNAKSKASNSLNIKFTLVEPYGLTFLDRLLSVAETSPFNCPNYLEMPYLIEIDFIANPTGSLAGSSKAQIVDQKRIPIRLTNLRIKPGVEGSVYNIEAIPFNHLAFLNTIAAVPASVSVIGGTVGEFFAEEQKFDNREENDQRAEAELEKLKFSLLFGGAVLTPEAESAEKERIAKQFIDRVSSFTAAYNDYFKNIANSNDEERAFTEPPVQIKFLIDEEIANSLIVRESETESRTTKMNDLGEGVSATVKDGVLAFGKTKQDFPVSAGTNIIQLIDRVIQKSEYVYNQVKEVQAAREQRADAEQRNDNRGVREAEETLRKYKQLNWYKIIPQVDIGEFDIKRNAFAKKVTYSIKTYKVANAYHPEFEKSRIKKSKISRSYNYLYTGLNQDIIDVDIDFDSTYFTSIQAFKKNKSRTSGGKHGSRPRTGTRLSANEKNNKLADNEKGQVNDQGITYQSRIANSAESGQYYRQDEPESQVVNDLAQSLYTSQRGDMLNIRCKIVGDPAFIKQDDVYFNPASEGYNNYVPSNDLDSAPIDPTTGDITFDGQQVYVQLLIKNSVDIDDSIGITNKGLVGGNGKIIKLSNGRNLNGTFSGVYKVLTVQNTLSSGEFVQTLDLIKMPNDFLENEAVDNQSTVISLPVVPIDNSESVPVADVDAEENENGVFAQDIALLVSANATTAETIDADNITDSDIATEVGTQAPEQQQRGIFAGDIENLG